MLRFASCCIAFIGIALVGCSDSVSDPNDPPPAPAGVDFGLAVGTPGAHHAEGTPGSSEPPLAGQFAVAVPDSLGGLVLLSYDEATSDLFILQATNAGTGEYACGPVTGDAPCHARLFENVRMEDGAVRVDGRLDLVGGSLTLNEVDPDEVAGSFDAVLERTSGDGIESIEVTDGTVLVDLLPGPVEDGGLWCLVELTMEGGCTG